MHLILASSSRYRAAQLQQLGLPFQQISADIDETEQQGEAPHALVSRLALAKAQKVADQQSDGVLVIGSDQVASLGTQILTKPGTVDRALAQLNACSGQSVMFYTGFAVLQVKADRIDVVSQGVVETLVAFKSLSAQQIESYIAKEQPLDCAGSFKCEGLGIALFERIRSDDPSALVGLPLIAVAKALSAAGLDPLTSQS